MLVPGGFLDEFAVPLWVIAISASRLTLGTLLGGWDIARTVGFGIYKLYGLDALLASLTVIFGASLFGGPEPKTHVVSTSIMGIGASERPRAVQWSKAQEILATWLFTRPGAAILSAVAYGHIALNFAN
jgi:PiT family inorganic phosphate transporter